MSAQLYAGLLCGEIGAADLPQILRCDSRACILHPEQAMALILAYTLYDHDWYGALRWY